MTSGEMISLIELIWLVISGIAAAAWLVVPIIWPWLKRRYLLEWRPRQLKASRRGAKDLEHLVKLMGQVEEWLSATPTQTELLTKVRHDLWKVACNVILEKMSYIAVHSNEDSERISALWNLSQVEDAKAIEEIKDVIRGVVRDKSASNSIRDVARAVLQELEEREKIENDMRGKH